MIDLLAYDPEESKEPIFEHGQQCLDGAGQPRFAVRDRRTGETVLETYVQSVAERVTWELNYGMKLAKSFRSEEA